VDRAIDNVGIDSPYRLLDLTDQQRAQMRVRQERRDRVLLDARNRLRKNYRARVQQRFEDSVYDLLTPDQQAELDQFLANIEVNIEDVWRVEIANLPIDDPYAAAWPKWTDWAKGILERSLRRRATWLTRAKIALDRWARVPTKPIPPVAAAPQEGCLKVEGRV
jgi:hypothetical protein